MFSQRRGPSEVTREGARRVGLSGRRRRRRCRGRASTLAQTDSGRRWVRWKRDADGHARSWSWLSKRGLLVAEGEGARVFPWSDAQLGRTREAGGVSSAGVLRRPGCQAEGARWRRREGGEGKGEQGPKGTMFASRWCGFLIRWPNFSSRTATAQPLRRPHAGPEWPSPA